MNTAAAVAAAAATAAAALRFLQREAHTQREREQIMTNMIQAKHQQQFFTLMCVLCLYVIALETT
jgi:hypothetical protein